MFACPGGVFRYQKCHLAGQVGKMLPQAVASQFAQHRISQKGAPAFHHQAVRYGLHPDCQHFYQ